MNRDRAEDILADAKINTICSYSAKDVKSAHAFMAASTLAQEKRAATSRKKEQWVRRTMLSLARKSGISLQEAFAQITQQQWAARNVAAPWWWYWERFATQDEMDDARVTAHIAKAQSLATEQGITFIEGLEEYKKKMHHDILCAMATRQGFMGMCHGGQITTAQRDALYSENILTNFDFHWAGGDVSKFRLSGGVQPNLQSYKHRVGRVAPLAVLPPSTTDVALFGRRVLRILGQRTLATHQPKYLLRSEPIMLPASTEVEPDEKPKS